MGLWETISGRSRPKRANLDALFLVPSAADHAADRGRADARPATARSATERPPEPGSTRPRTTSWRCCEGAADAPQVQTDTDEFGFTWLQVHRAPDDPEGMAGLCTDLHAVNTTLESEGFGPGLLCSLIPFADPTGRRVGLVYLYKKGTFYPFAPTGPQRRDNLLELQVRDTLRAELPIEPELSGWMALWGAPGL